jgi:hypothetical protein
MSRRSRDEARHEWDEIIGGLEQDSADCGAMLRQLATAESQPSSNGTAAVRCTGRGSARRGRVKHVWEYWTRRR